MSRIFTLLAKVSTEELIAIPFHCNLSYEYDTMTVRKEVRLIQSSVSS
jgi:hypothetical protein